MRVNAFTLKNTLLRKQLQAPCPHVSINGVVVSTMFLHTLPQKTGFRHYLGGLLGVRERKNLTQMSKDACGVTYHRLHHFLTEDPWNAGLLNERRLQLMQQYSQTKIRRGFTLIIDDSGLVKKWKINSRNWQTIYRRNW